MTIAPTLVFPLMIVVLLVLSLVTLLLALIWSRLRALPMARAARLVDDLSQQQQTLETLLSRVEGESDGSKAPAPPVPAPVAPRPSRPGVRADQAAASAMGGPTLIAVPDLAAPSPRAAFSAAEELGRRFGAIWELAEAGASPEAIARDTGQPIGQVELILALRRQMAAGSARRP